MRTKDENKNIKYWLFNIYYAKNPDVWVKSKELGVASMQYEEGLQNQKDITRNINIMKQINIGDYLVAYTGNKGFLGIGQVTKEFFEETDPSKYIGIGENNWRQRVGVNWTSTVDKPVYYDYKEENSFKKFVGLINQNVVMGSYAIFEMDKSGFENVENLLNKGSEIEMENTKGENTFKDYVASRRFKFDDDVLHNYIVSLMSKPFVILSGISGTGKTKIAQFFAEYMCPDEEKIVDDISEEIEEDPFSFTYKVQPYNLKYKQLVVPQKYAKLLDLPDQGKSKLIRLRFEDIEDECRIYNTADGGYRQITLCGKIGEYIKNHCRIGEYIKISFEKEDDKDVIIFKHINTIKKKIKTPSNRYAFISVRPDWVDNRGLLGFFNPITEKYQATELLKLMLRAKEDNKPYFVILDEMNLAKVEYYFSDFLSCLESRTIGLDGEVRSESIKLHDCEEEVLYIDEDGIDYVIPSRLEIPLNIYFTGTVNVDETTYMFSPKVLDRGSVIEFNEVDLENYRDLLFDDNAQNENGANIYADEEFISKFTDDFQYHAPLIKKQFNIDSDMESCFAHIININNILKKYNLHFGYRVVDEILFYLHHAKETGYFDELRALDYQILQRILPKMYGNRKKLEAPLTELLAYCFGWEPKELTRIVSLQVEDNQYIRAKLEEESISEDMLKSQFSKKEIRFKKSAVKLHRMLDLLKNNGFVSFIE